MEILAKHIFKETVFNEERNAYNCFEYINYYEENIHDYISFTDSDGKKVTIYDGSKIEDLCDSINLEVAKEVIKDIINDKKLDKLQKDLFNEGKEICMVNICLLAIFLIEKNKSKYCFLLKPQIKDTLSELKKVKKITFTNEDETKVESTSSLLIKTIIDSLKEIKEDNYAVLKYARIDELVNKSVIQAYFVNDMSEFLNKYFPVKRKKNALVSTKEQELIRYLMEKYKLSPVVVTDSRFRQLKMLYKDIKNYDNPKIAKLPEFGYVPFRFIPYSLWSKGKIDIKDLNSFDMKIGDIFNFEF